jgi:hypothetical protein
MSSFRITSERPVVRAPAGRARESDAPDVSTPAPDPADRFVRSKSAIEGRLVAGQQLKAATALLLNVAAFASFGFGGLSGPRRLREPPLQTDNGRIERLIDGV